MNKVIIDTNQIKKISGFVLNLDKIENIENIYLDLDNAIKECEVKISEGNFELAKELLHLANKISEYGDGRVNTLKVKYYFESINYKYKNNKHNDLKGAMELLLEIKMFYLILSSLSNADEELVNSSIESIKNIKESILIEELLESEIKNSVATVSVKKLDQFSEVYTFKELEKLKKIYKCKINEDITALKDKSSFEVIDLVKKILKDEYPLDYLNSKELNNLIIKDSKIKFENYNTLLELANKAYLVYRFNKSESLKEKTKSLYSNLIPSYIDLSIINKEYVAKQLSELNEKYLVVDEFFEVLNSKIEEINKIKKSNSVPI